MSPEIHTTPFDSRFENLAAIGQESQNAARAASLDDQAAYQVETAVDEACSNIIEHAYGCKPGGMIIFSWQVTDQALVIFLDNWGKSFVPGKMPPDLPRPSIKKHKGHGLGLFFMHNYMDEVHFELLPDGGNRCILIKYRSAS